MARGDLCGIRSKNCRMKKFWILTVLLSLAMCSMGQSRLKVMVIFAHPDEGEIYAGGVSALYTQMGHEVKYLSLTNGDAGHYAMEPEELAKRRYNEAMHAKEILGLSAYEVLDYHDGILENTKEVREIVASFIQAWDADIVFTFYPARGGHNDNMNVGWIVREASALLDRDFLPVFIYMRDFHTASFSYIPDFAIDIDEVWETKLAACGAHESQVIEYNPEMEGVLEEVLASKEKQDDFLFHNAVPFSIVRPDNLLTLEKWYGKKWAEEVRFVEEFEMAEYGKQMDEKEVMMFFPMIGRAFTIPGKSLWFDSGLEVKQGQTFQISSSGTILWNLENRAFCSPDGAIPYTHKGDTPIPGVATGALIGKIGENESDCFFIGKCKVIQSKHSGRLFLGINDDHPFDNEGTFRARVKIYKR